MRGKSQLAAHIRMHQESKGETLKNKTVLITGGTGSLGQEITRQLLAQDVDKIIIYSRGEAAQVQMRRNITNPDKRVRYFIGDVRDLARLQRACCDVHYIVHAAALKHVDACAYNPWEAIKTNIHGAHNVIEAAIDRGVEKVLAISSDKAVNPVNLYGATKLCADKLFLNAGSYAPHGPLFSVIQFGNFWPSSGSVLHYWDDLVSKGAKKLPITDMRMTRFWITIETAAEHVIDFLTRMEDGNELFTPPMSAYKITDMAKNLYPGYELEEIGIREGEKLHEQIVTPKGVVVSSSQLNEEGHNLWEKKKLI